MHVRRSVLLAPVLLSVVTGCSGSAGKSTLNVACDGDERVLCLVNCNLGCSGTGCEITDIAQNQIVVFHFNTDVDPNTVSASSIQFRTASGDEPVGEFLVHGSIVEFVPQVLVVGAQSFFGFRAGETYTLTLPTGTDATAVRSTSNRALHARVACTLNVTGGIVDLNGVPPVSNLVAPAVAVDVSFDTIIQLEFNEQIDVTPFLTAGTEQGPIEFTMRRTRVVGGVRECDPEDDPVPLRGSPRVDLDAARGVSVVTMRPQEALPCDACVDVTVTDGVRDLSGRPAARQTFTFFTASASAPVFTVKAENFDGATFLDRDSSAGEWSGGRGYFASVGGDGIHGDFDPTVGTFLGEIAGKRTYVFDTDHTLIPETNTLTGHDITVTDGKYRYGQMVVPRDVRLRFTGNSPPQFLVRGKIEIQGTIEVKGEDRPLFVPANGTLPHPGQAGGQGGVFGGSGGKGGDRCMATGALPNHSGQDGQDCRVLGGHAFAAQLTGTRGRGSPLFPATGLLASVVPPPPPHVVGFIHMAAAGGGGGGNSAAGQGGRVVPSGRIAGTSTGSNTANTLTDVTKVWGLNEFSNRQVTILGGLGAGQTRTIIANTVNTVTVSLPWDTIPDQTSSYALRSDFIGPPATGGSAFPLFPIPPGAVSSSHFLVGGAGGGGAGSSPLLTLFISGVPSGSPTNPLRWAPGSGGTGGGGAIGFRAGDLLRVTAEGRIEAQGGAGGENLTAMTTADIAVPAPSGAGAGGSILLQSGDRVDLKGLIDYRGGSGGVVNKSSQLSTPTEQTRVMGGNGGHGVLRLEVRQDPSAAMLQQVQPPATSANVALLTERDAVSGFQSVFYSTGRAFGPAFVRYEIDAIVNNVRVTFSDDPAIGAPARFGSAPIQVRFQAGTVNPLNQLVVPGSLRRWCEFVGPQVGAPSLADDAKNGYRFLILIDTTTGQTIEIDEVRIVYRYC